MNDAFIFVALLVSMFAGPAVAAGLIAWFSRSTRAGVAAACGAMLLLLYLATRGGQGSEFSEPQVLLLAVFVFLPAFALGVVAAFIGGALRRSW